jgi:alpha-ketoglutarate-dependent taurine dioxygenase
LLVTLSLVVHTFLTGQCTLVPSYTITPLKLGAEIAGIHLQDHVNNSALFEKIKRDAYEHRLLLFRNQGQIPADILVAMFSSFGDTFVDPYSTQGKGEANHVKAPAPAIMRISNDPSEGFKGLGTTGWHIDGAYKPHPFSFLIFNSIKAPKKGATKFAGHREVISSMKQSTLRKLDHLWTAVTRTFKGERIYEIHPVLHTHPIVNESVLCIHLGYMRGVIQDYGTDHQTTLSLQQMLELKGEITHEIEKQDERLIYAHKWNEGDLVIIDNLQIMHFASKETQLPKEEIGLRILHRLSINGVFKPVKTQDMLF